MKSRYIYMLFIFGILIIFIIIFSSVNIDSYDVKYVYNSEDLKCKFTISNIATKTENYEISVYYPVTEYKALNEKINSVVNNYINQFKSNLQGNKNKLTIDFNHYEYNEYTSFVFNVGIYDIKNHDTSYINTINFNTKSESIITIDDILNKDSNNFQVIYKCVYETLSKDKEIANYINIQDLKESLCSNKENYSNFYIKNDAFVVCFCENTVAPKVVGEYWIPISISKIKL